MAWSDEPTEAQMNALFNLLKWVISREEFSKMEKYLMENATRREVSNELGRTRDLSIAKKLDKDNIFAGEIWEKYEH